jgi:ferrous iron transport protein A
MQRNAPGNIGIQRVRLSDLPDGTAGRVCELSGEPEVCVRLREIGFCESAVIEKIAGKRMLICQLCQTRIALSDAAASHILVEPIQARA